MKPVVCVTALLFCIVTAHAQQYDTIPAYRKDSLLPAFSILQTDSTWFVYAQVPDKMPVVVIYFNPDCGHCHLTAKQFNTARKKFADVYFVWVSYMDLGEIKTFARDYGLSGARNTCIGRDPNYFLPAFFKVTYTPYIAVYNSNRKLLQTFDGGTDPDTVYRLLYPDK